MVAVSLSTTSSNDLDETTLVRRTGISIMAIGFAPLGSVLMAFSLG
jgi:hypothetical protein